MAVIQLPQFQQPQAKIGQTVVKDTGAARVAEAKYQFQSNIWNGIVSLAQTGIAIWKRHEATVAQDEFDTGKLTYAKAMNDEEMRLAETPLSPSSDDPYPTYSALEKTHTNIMQRLEGYSNQTVRNALKNYYESEFLKRGSAAKLSDMKQTKAKSFDDLSENFQYQVQQGDLDEARNTVATMRGMGLIDDVQADSLLDGAYQNNATDVALQHALSFPDKAKGAAAIGRLETYESYDKNRAFSPEQKKELLTLFNEKWKAREAATYQQREGLWYQATNEITVAIDKNRDDVQNLAKIRDSVRGDRRLDDFKDHTGKKEHYLNFIDSLIDDSLTPKEGQEKDWTSADNRLEIENARFDSSISNRAFNTMLESMYSNKEVSKKLFTELYNKDNARQESLVYANGFNLVKKAFDDFIGDNSKKLTTDQTNEVRRLQSEAVRQFDEYTGNPDMIGLKADQRLKNANDKATAIVDSYNFKKISTLIEDTTKPLTRQMYSDGISGGNDAKTFQAKIQNNRMVFNDKTKANLNQHEANITGKMEAFTGTPPTDKIDWRSYSNLPTGEQQFFYQADGKPRTVATPREMDEKGPVPKDLSKFYVKDPNTGELSQLYRIQLDEATNVWKYQIWDGKAKTWTEIDNSLKQNYWPIFEQSYFKNRMPQFVPGKQTPSDNILDALENPEGGT